MLFIGLVINPRLANDDLLLFIWGPVTLLYSLRMAFEAAREVKTNHNKATKLKQKTQQIKHIKSFSKQSFYQF